jgi:hypothetical protein
MNGSPDRWRVGQLDSMACSLKDFRRGSLALFAINVFWLMVCPLVWCPGHSPGFGYSFQVRCFDIVASDSQRIIDPIVTCASLHELHESIGIFCRNKPAWALSGSCRRVVLVPANQELRCLSSLLPGLMPAFPVWIWRCQFFVSAVHWMVNSSDSHAVPTCH